MFIEITEVFGRNSIEETDSEPGVKFKKWESTVNDATKMRVG